MNSYYQNTIEQFLEANEDEILRYLTYAVAMNQHKFKRGKKKLDY